MSIKSTFRRLTLATPISLALLFAGLTSAYASTCTVNTMPYWDGGITSGYLAQTQTFAAPSASCNALLDYEFVMAGRSSAGQFQFNVFQWGPSGPVGSPLYTTTLSWGTSASVFDVTGINLTLTVGQVYGAEADFLGYSGQSIYFQDNQTGYPGFDGWWYNPGLGGWIDFPGLNTNFVATFGSVPEPGSILLLGPGVLGVAGMLRRKIRLRDF